MNAALHANDADARLQTSADDVSKRCRLLTSMSVAETLDALSARGLIAASDCAAIEKLAAADRRPLDLAICGLALAGEEALASGFAEIVGCERLPAAASVDLALAKKTSAAFLAATRTVPVSERDGEALVAIADPTDLTGPRGCAFALGCPVRPVIATATEIDAFLRQLDADHDVSSEREVSLEVNGGDAERLKDLASAEPAVRLCNRLVAEAVKARASDIHLEPEERSFRVRFRVDGSLVEREALTIAQGLAVVSRFKILSSLDIAERRRPQDGRFTMPVGGRPIDMRISATPNVHGEGVVLRLLQRDDVSFDLEALGFTPEAAALLYRLSDRPNGILLLTGPTGSGKTTTLYALLQRLAARDVKILTIEDPVEYKIDGVSQTQVNPAIGLTFAHALRSFLRHDPDIIMVGEMRDLETARTAVQAALTGHLVLSTLHTNDAVTAVTRLLDMGVEDYLVASTLLGVVGQRLVRKICSLCGGASGPRDLATAPCPRCEGSGFYGRLAIAEILDVDEALRATIKGRPTAAELLRIARANGFRSLKEDGEAKIAKGLTTRQELLKAVAG
ncbi:MAG: GspE/PulE family protein [Pseudomonadota bacterium]